MLHVAKTCEDPKARHSAIVNSKSEVLNRKYKKTNTKGNKKQEERAWANTRIKEVKEIQK